MFYRNVLLHTLAVTSVTTKLLLPWQGILTHQKPTEILLETKR